MTDRRMGDDFAASGGKRELEIFLLSDDKRREFRMMLERFAQERDDLRKRQEERREKDIEAAKREIMREKPAPDLVPRWDQVRKSKGRNIETLAVALITVRNEKEARDMDHVHRQREDNFLTKQTEERLLRAATDRSRTRDERGSPEMRRDFDKSRDRER